MTVRERLLRVVPKLVVLVVMGIWLMAPKMSRSAAEGGGVSTSPYPAPPPPTLDGDTSGADTTGDTILSTFTLSR